MIARSPSGHRCGEQIRQLQFMRETQGDAFAQQVKAKVVQAGKARVK